MEDTITIKVTKCPRCDENHLGIIFSRLDTPVQVYFGRSVGDKPELNICDYFAICPITSCKILMANMIH